MSWTFVYVETVQTDLLWDKWLCDQQCLRTLNSGGSWTLPRLFLVRSVRLGISTKIRVACCVCTCVCVWWWRGEGRCVYIYMEEWIEESIYIHLTVDGIKSSVTIYNKLPSAFIQRREGWRHHVFWSALQDSSFRDQVHLGFC